MRKEAVVVITREGRDKGKVFHLREMSASQVESWAARLILALTKSGVDLPEGILDTGMIGIASIGVKALGGVDWSMAEPLLREMMQCVRFQPDPNQPKIIRDLIEDDIEELATRLQLREEVITLHTGFSIAAVTSGWRTSQVQNAEAAADKILTGQDHETSPSP